MVTIHGMTMGSEAIEFIKNVYQDISHFLKTVQGVPLGQPLSLSYELAEAVHKTLLMIGGFWELRYITCSISSLEVGSINLDEGNYIFKRITQKISLDQYRSRVDAICRHLRDFVIYQDTLSIPYGTLRAIRWKISAYLNFRQTFG